jgi:hypothetical protein
MSNRYADIDGAEGRYDVIVSEEVLESARTELANLPVSVGSDPRARVRIPIVILDDMTPATYLATREALIRTGARTVFATSGRNMIHKSSWRIPGVHVALLTDHFPPLHDATEDLVGRLLETDCAITVPSSMVEAMRDAIANPKITVGEDAENDIATIRLHRIDASFVEISAALAAIGSMNPEIPVIIAIPQEMMDILTIPGLSHPGGVDVIVQGTVRCGPDVTLAQALLERIANSIIVFDEMALAREPFESDLWKEILSGMPTKRHVADLDIERDDLPSRGFDHRAANQAPRSQGRGRRR